MTRIAPFLWYAARAEEAARFYTSVFPDSRLTRVSTLPGDTPSGPAGTVQVVEFELCGQPFTAIAAGPLDPFNHAVSFIVRCETQEEIDRYWSALAAGGHELPCGWLQDRFGLYWQVVPAALAAMMAAAQREPAARAMTAMLKMKKLDLAALERAFAGDDGG